MIKYPMLLKYVPRQMIWGGNRLKTKYNKESEYENIGESWELTCRSEARSVVANGEYSGIELCKVLGCNYDFPLLIKFIDAEDRLSVQVHPDDSITDENGIPLGKTEMWYIIDAEKDAHIIYGLNDGITLEKFSEMVEKKAFESALRKVQVKAGDCFFIPAGQVHAIGKGILLAEIQQNSDTTYRIFDYDRLDKNGNPRELHIEKALNVIKAHTDADIEAIRYKKGFEEGCLANCDKFKCKKHTSPERIEAKSIFKALIFIKGEGHIEYNCKLYPARGGDTYYIPEGISVNVCGNLEFLSANPAN